MPKLSNPIRQDLQLSQQQQQQIYEQTMKNQNFEFLLPNNQPNTFSKLKTNLNIIQNISNNDQSNLPMITNTINHNNSNSKNTNLPSLISTSSSPLPTLSSTSSIAIGIPNHLFNRITHNSSNIIGGVGVGGDISSGISNTTIGISKKITNLNPSLLNSLNPMSNLLHQQQQQIHLQLKNEEKKIIKKESKLNNEEDLNNPTLKKKPFKHGWTKEEHLKFLTGLEIHGKGQWKQIATLVGTRSPTQIQSHAQKYFLRQNQQVKNKRSIHDLTIEDLKNCFSDEKKQKTE